MELPKEARRIIWVESLQDEEVTRIIMDDSDTKFYSPTQASLVAPRSCGRITYHSLLDYKETEVQFLKECVSFEENDNGIIAKILDRTTNHEHFGN